ncbi:glyoxalase [Pseudidiomarina tainanensis]|jgi:predicted lactoylglutathione lyase|uniref:Glyoxalase n=1 Tax=Pseudidiomarina tainanensis TaxID=502365 RepID=A0ACD2HHK1_9GAMM|nr:VOC family protein [Pseudidiomarina tainanensis]RZQ56046.1 glyoxalase [Pseudidiomarina tainanensis]
MKPRISFITLTVDNLEQAVAFYRDGLGWPTEGIIGEQYENGAAAFFKLENNLMFALWPRQSLANDSGLPLGKAEPTHVLLAHNVDSGAAVDAVLYEAKAAGASWVKLAQTTSWGGYAGYFMDPEKHLWEVVYNPYI